MLYKKLFTLYYVKDIKNCSLFIRRIGVRFSNHPSCKLTLKNHKKP